MKKSPPINSFTPLPRTKLQIYPT
eukprot:COSAG01_NODE_70334_length_259_cov_0.481250_1_plen_23_part_10